jgi:very-short-patch-repair endonuclease
VPAICAHDGGKPQGPLPDAALAALAAEHHGIVDLVDLASVGISARAAQQRATAGRLHRIHRGVSAVGHSRLTSDGRRLAAVRAYGREAVASHLTAAALWGLRRSARLEVTLPTARMPRDGITPRESGHLGPEDRAVIRNIPVTSLARTLVDLAEVLAADRLERILDHAGRHEAFDRRALEAALVRLRGRHGGATLRALLGTPSAGMTRSGLEDAFLALCRRSGLPLPRLNTHVVVGSRLVEADAVFPGHGLIVELDGAATHDTTPAFHADRRRDAALASHGFQTLRYTWERVMGEPATVTAELRAVLALRRRRVAQ